VRGLLGAVKQVRPAHGQQKCPVRALSIVVVQIVLRYDDVDLDKAT